jgi:hypothetical protein
VTELEVLHALTNPLTRATAQVAMGWRQVVDEARKTLEAAGPDEGGARAAQVSGVLAEAIDISGNPKWGPGRHATAIVGALSVLMDLRAVPADELEQALQDARHRLYR